MPTRHFCGSPVHAIDRRAFLGAGLAGAAAFADMTGLNVLTSPVLAGELKKNQKRVILLWLAGGASQLETWDPKPGASTGGPFRAIKTDVPGLAISELMPEMAKRMKHVCLIRGLNTRIGDHGGAAKIMMRGRRDEASLRYPDLGAVVAREMGLVDSKVPDYVTFYTQTEGRNMAPGEPGFLGARYAPMELTTKNTPEYIHRPDGISDKDHVERAELRNLLGKDFVRGRSSDAMFSQAEAYGRVRGLMSSEKLFDITQEPQKVRDR